MAEAAKLKIPILIRSSMLDQSHPRRIANLADRFPDATIIMGHMGFILNWPDAIEFARQYENLILETSSTAMTASLVRRCVDEVGEDRIVFGTNMPIDYPGPNIVRITHADITDEARKKIMGENIARIVGVKV
jgi:hypothetical protein